MRPYSPGAVPAAGSLDTATARAFSRIEFNAKVHRGWIPASFTIASASAVQSLPVKRTRAS